jgi:hypothetical protein
LGRMRTRRPRGRLGKVRDRTELYIGIVGPAGRGRADGNMLR